MGSRIGSIAILLVIAAIVIAVVVLIGRLNLLDTGEPDAPVIVASLDDGELVLLNEPQSVTVTISSGSPIATLELFVDAVKVADVIPAYSQDRGAWIGPFVWTPQRLGFANVSIVVLDAQGQEFSREIQVEVTDDRARVAAALRLEIQGIEALQQFPVGADIRIDAWATGRRPIERFDFLENDKHQVSATATLQDDGKYWAAFQWNPPNAGEVRVTVVAIDADGSTESQTIPVVIVDPDSTAPIAAAASTPADEQAQAESEQTALQSEPADDGLEGDARIMSPQDGQQFTNDDEFALEVSLDARGVGPVASALLYITPVAPNGTLGSPLLIYSSNGPREAGYTEQVAVPPEFITGSGTYELEFVVFTPATPEDNRYGHRIRIHVVAALPEDGDEPDPQAADDSADELDLAIVRARQADDDPRRLHVSITNSGSADIERINVLLTVADANSGAELASAEVTLGIDSDDTSTIPLDLEVESGVEIAAIVVLEADGDAESSNNTFRVTLSPLPEPVQQSAQQQAEPSEPADAEPDPQTDADEADPAQAQSEPQSEAGPAPDLSLSEIRATDDGYVLITVTNNGDAPANSFTIVISDADGNELEIINRGDAAANPLAPLASEVLTSRNPHSGALVIRVVADPADGERELADNTTAFELP